MEADQSICFAQLLPPHAVSFDADKLRALCGASTWLALARPHHAPHSYLAYVHFSKKNERRIHNGLAGGADFRRSPHPSRSGRLGLLHERIVFYGAVSAGVFGVSPIP